MFIIHNIKTKLLFLVFFVVGYTHFYYKPFSSTNKNRLFLNVFHITKIKFKHYCETAPFWVPCWSIQFPPQKIHERFPSTKQLETDANLILYHTEILKQHQFFRLFQADLNFECPFWARQEMCTDENSCQICECDDNQIPQLWKEKPMQNFIDPQYYKTENIHRDVNSVSSDYTIQSLFTEKQFTKKKPTYIDLTLNRPGFTGYKGQNIWKYIYKESLSSDKNKISLTTPINQEIQISQDEIFFKILSGMQTLIMIQASEYHYLKLPTEKYVKQLELMKRNGSILDLKTFRSQHKPNLNLFKHRVALHQDWISNLYFSFGILLQALCRLKPILQQCDCSTGDAVNDALAMEKLKSLLDINFQSCNSKYLDIPLFDDKQVEALERFENVSKIMDCLECQKCRLHGKIKVTALQLAIKVLGKHSRVYSIRRNDIIALVNALNYYSDSIFSLHRFDERLSRYKFIWTNGFALICILFCNFFIFKLNFNYFFPTKKKPINTSPASTVTENDVSDTSTTADRLSSFEQSFLTEKKKKKKKLC